MSKIDHRALCRKAAAECVEFARMIADPEIKKTLLTRAQEWLKLAYAEHDTDFERLLTGFNKDQMGLQEQGAHRVQAMPMQQQPVQQQQSKQKPSGGNS
jgi:hypothetical protein